MVSALVERLPANAGKACAGLKVAVVHDWMWSYAGSERVLEQILSLFPDADLFCVADCLRESDRSFLGGRAPKTTFIQRLPRVRRYYKQYLPLMPLAIESLDMSPYDVVISSSHAVAKGVLTNPAQFHICYCHTPMRYAWDLQPEYLSASGLSGGMRGFGARVLLHYLRLWDTRASNGVDQFVANSRYVARRIWRAYRREAEVVYPPVDTDYFRPDFGEREDFYFTCSRMVAYKKIDFLVSAFSAMPDKKLVVAGDGPCFAACKARAGGNVQLLGEQPRHVVRELMQRARAFVFAAEEDFGIALAEAQACGTPAICYGRGGATEIVEDGATGVWFRERSTDALAQAVGTFEASRERFRGREIRARAERFSHAAFKTGFWNLLAPQVGLPERQA